MGDLSVKELTHQREQLKKAYPYAKWAKKVNLMQPAQVTALYLKFKSQGKI